MIYKILLFFVFALVLLNSKATDTRSITQNKGHISSVSICGSKSQDLWKNARKPHQKYNFWGCGLLGPSYQGNYGRYMPVQLHPDYGFPHYNRLYKYPYSF